VRVKEHRSDHHVILDDNYIPPCLAAGEQTRLLRFLQELHGLLVSRRDVLSQRVLQTGRGGVAEVADFMMLELVNRYAGQTWAMQQFPGEHPMRWFQQWVELASALS